MINVERYFRPTVGAGPQWAVDQSREDMVLATDFDEACRKRDEEIERLRSLLASLHVKIALPLNDDVADRKAMMAEIDAALASTEENT